MVTANRTGASRVADIPADILQALNAGKIEAVTLVENLATDFNVLLSHTLPNVAAVASINPKTGVTKRMMAVAIAIVRYSGNNKVPF